MCYNYIMKILNIDLLTKREKDVFEVMITGATNKSVAEKLGLSVSTIKSHKEKIYKKFNVHNNVELLVYFIKNGYIEIECTD